MKPRSRISVLCVIVLLFLMPLLRVVSPANADGQAEVSNVAPTITNDSIYDDTHTTNVNNTLNDKPSRWASKVVANWGFLTFEYQKLG